MFGYAKAEKKKQVAPETRSGSKIDVYSAGYKAGKKNSFAKITINGDEIMTRKQSRRGINLIVLKGSDHSVILNEHYNTYTKKLEDSARMVKDFKKVPKGSIVIAAVKDDCQKRLKYSGKRMFMSMGADHIWKIGYKKAWAFIGIKGMKKGVDKTGKTAEFSTILSYVKEVKKTKEVQKVNGGSKI